MASGTRSKVSLSSSLSISDAQDIDESLEHDSRRYNSSDDRPRSSVQKHQINQNSVISPGDHSSVILRTSCGFLYPVPRSIRSPQIEIYQNGLRSLTLVNFRSASDIAQWFDKFLEHAMLINMHEFFTGRVIFAV
jgi:hypothetical protein